jgi:hypothetical protein
MVKFFDLIVFSQIFHAIYRAPTREPELGHYPMALRLFPVGAIASGQHFSIGMWTAWASIRHCPSFKAMAGLRERVWKLLEPNYYRICIDIDTTVETLCGDTARATAVSLAVMPCS